MKVTALFILTIVLACTFRASHAQSTVAVSEPVLSLTDRGIQITYDILNSPASDYFTIRLEVTDSRGRIINARSLQGDFGPHIPGGVNKKIYWDIEADSIFLDEEIFVQVYASAEQVPKVEEALVAREIVSDEEPAKEEPVDLKEPTSSAESSVKTLNRTALILQSVAFPGLGLSMANKGQPHWIKGVVGYGCIAGAIYFNQKAVSTYEEYTNSDHLAQVDELYNRSVRQDVTSEVMAYAAIGIWVTDLVWTILGTSGLSADHMSSNHAGFSIGTLVDPQSSVPLVALRYNF